VDASGADYATILVWDLKAAAGLVDGVRQHLFCTSCRGPLHNPHRPPRRTSFTSAAPVSRCLRRRADARPARAACRLALDAVSIPARPPSAPNDPVSGPSRCAARWCGCVRSLISSTALCRLGSCRGRSGHYLKDEGYMTSASDEAKVRPIDGLDDVQARLPQAIQPHHVVVKADFAVPVLVVAAMLFLPPLCPARRCPRTFCQTPRLGRQVLLLRRCTTGRCRPRIGNDVGN
jgi:hypothetical protein